MKNLYVIIIGFLGLLALDFLWLRVLSGNLYKEEIGKLMKTNINFVSVFLLYVLLFAGIYFFVLNNSYSSSIMAAALVGGFFGLVTYGVYDLTNFAVLKDYTLKIVIIDMIWGTFLGGSVGAFVKFLSMS